MSNWIDVKDRLPDFIEGKDYSENVWAWENNHTAAQIMCLALEQDDEGGWGKVWCNCYEKVYGEGEYDDNYEVTHWQPLLIPSPPNPQQ